MVEARIDRPLLVARSVRLAAEPAAQLPPRAAVDPPPPPPLVVRLIERSIDHPGAPGAPLDAGNKHGYT